jgi:hypothetical protein
MQFYDTNAASDCCSATPTYCPSQYYFCEQVIHFCTPNGWARLAPSSNAYSFDHIFGKNAGNPGTRADDVGLYKYALGRTIRLYNGPDSTADPQLVGVYTVSIPNVAVPLNVVLFEFSRGDFTLRVGQEIGVQGSGPATPHRTKSQGYSVEVTVDDGSHPKPYYVLTKTQMP